MCFPGIRDLAQTVVESARHSGRGTFDPAASHCSASPLQFLAINSTVVRRRYSCVYQLRSESTELQRTPPSLVHGRKPHSTIVLGALVREGACMLQSTCAITHSDQRMRKASLGVHFEIQRVLIARVCREYVPGDCQSLLIMRRGLAIPRLSMTNDVQGRRCFPQAGADTEENRAESSRKTRRLPRLYAERRW
jgi:hypothetical protein